MYKKKRPRFVIEDSTNGEHSGNDYYQLEVRDTKTGALIEYYAQLHTITNPVKYWFSNSEYKEDMAKANKLVRYLNKALSREEK